MVDETNMNPNDNFYMYYEIIGDDSDERLPEHSGVVQVGAPLLF